MYHLFQSMNQGGVKWNHVALLRIFNNPSQDSLAIAIGHVWQVLTPAYFSRQGKRSNLSQFLFIVGDKLLSSLHLD